MVLQRGPENIHPGRLGHVEINQDDVELAALDCVESFFPPSDQRDVIPVHLQDAGAALPQSALIVNHEDPDAGFDFGGDSERIAAADLPWRGFRSTIRVSDARSHCTLL
jgi:hypothetical protein